MGDGCQEGFENKKGEGTHVDGRGDRWTSGPCRMVGQRNASANKRVYNGKRMDEPISHFFARNERVYEYIGWLGGLL